MTRLRTSCSRTASTAKRSVAGFAVLGAALLSGCSGLGGNSSLTCKMPDGARCDSVSSTYSESLRGELPGQRKRPSFDSEPATSGTSQRGADGVIMQADPRMVPVSMPLRSQARVMRVWIKAWEDSDGDLHDQTFVYLPVNEGRWMVEHKQREARSAYAPVKPSPRPTIASPTVSTGMTSSQMQAPGAEAAQAATRATAPAERLGEAMQRKSTSPATVTRNEGGRNGS